MCTQCTCRLLMISPVYFKFWPSASKYLMVMIVQNNSNGFDCFWLVSTIYAFWSKIINKSLFFESTLFFVLSYEVYSLVILLSSFVFLQIFLRYVFCFYLVLVIFFITLSSQSDSHKFYDSDTQSSRFRNDSPSAFSSFIEVLSIEALPYSVITYSNTCDNLEILDKGVVLVRGLRGEARCVNLRVNL